MSSFQNVMCYCLFIVIGYYILCGIISKLYSNNTEIKHLQQQLQQKNDILNQIAISIYNRKRSIIVENDQIKQAKPETVEFKGCYICEERNCDAVIMPCCHGSFCYECISKLPEQRCPECRSANMNVIKIFI